jgi:LPXTG-motif cell wall-anchored protein
MNKILIIIAALLVALGAGIHGDPVSAENDGKPPKEGVCAELTHKVETPSGPYTVTITAPDGWLISETCVKAGSINQGNGPEYKSYDPPVKSVTISHSSGKQISHYSYLKVREPQPEPTTTVPPTEPPTTPPTTQPEEPTTVPTVPEEPTTIPTTVPETDAPTTVVTTPETDAPTTTVADTTTVAPETSIDTPPTTAVVETVVVPTLPPAQPTPAPAPEVTPDELPATGGESTTALYAGLLLLAGAGATLIARRRQNA